MKKNSYYETDEYVFFYGSIYSQWAKYDMVIDDIKYNCNEQYMMFKKASFFGDDVAKNKIMESQSPAEQKYWGRRVKKFDKDRWEVVARDIVFEANYAKFTQHEDLKKQLLETGDKVIVEASPYDCIWGVGLRASDPDILDEKNWRGKNWLGIAIMKVRDSIKLKKLLKIGENCGKENRN